MSEAVWNKAFTQGSRALQDRLKKVHAKNPKFQAWMKSSGHGSGESVKQASKEVKPTARVKSLQTKSLQAYGATKGVKVGGEHGSGEIKDTIAPLTRDQHSKVQAAERAAKAAAKAAAPAKTKKPLSKAERMSAIARAVTKAKSKDRFDVPTMNPDDMDHDDLRDLHQSLHVRGTYSEEVEMNEGAKEDAEKVLGGPVKTKPANAPTGKLPYPFRRARNLARQAMKAGKSVTESTTEVSEVNEMNHGKKLAKMIMAKQSQHPIAQNMGEAIKDVADVGEYDYEGDMAKSQLRSILANAKRLHDMLEDTTNLPEWVQSKITLAEDYILTAANYMEGEMNEEVEQVDEKIDLVKAKMGDVVKDFYKSKAPQFKGKSMAKRREMAVAAKLGAEREAGMREEVEQIDERNMENKAKKNVAVQKIGLSTYVHGKDVGVDKYDHKPAFGKDPAGFKITGRSVMKDPKVKSSQVTALKKANEEVEQLSEGPSHLQYSGRIHSNVGDTPHGEEKDEGREYTLTVPRHRDLDDHLNGKKAYSRVARENPHLEPHHVKAILNGTGDDVEDVEVEHNGKTYKHRIYNEQEPDYLYEEVEQVDEVKAVKAYDKKGKLVGRYRSMDHAKQMKPGHTYKVEEGVVTEAEGKVAVTPKEKELAAHHGDPKRITYGDVIKARLKSAAAKKMGK